MKDENTKILCLTSLGLLLAFLITNLTPLQAQGFSSGLSNIAYSLLPNLNDYQGYEVTSASITTPTENNSVSISTDKNEYTVGEYVVITGEVSNVIPGKNQIRLDIYDSQGVVIPNLHVYNNQVEIVSSLHLIKLENNSFTYIIGTKNREPGIYKILGTYGQQTGQAELKIMSPQSPIDKSNNPQTTEATSKQSEILDQNNTSKGNVQNNSMPASTFGSELTNYENSKYNFALQYPSNWTISETNLQPNQAVTFYLTDPSIKRSNLFPATLLISVEATAGTKDIEAYPDEFIKTVFTDPSQFKIIKRTDGVLSGNKAKGLVLYDYTNKRTLMELRIFSIIGNNIYRVGYFSEPAEFSSHLGEISLILKSFKVVNPSASTSNLEVTPAPITESDTNSQITANQSYFKFKEGDLAVTFIGKWGSFGHDESQFDHPAGVAVHPDSNAVYVADINNNRIQKFTLDGQFVTEWGSFGTDDGKFNHPADVAIDKDSRTVFVTDIENNRVQIFNPDGQFISSFGSGGTAEGQFDHPGSIAIDSRSGFVFIADIGNNRVQKFSLDGTFVSTWGSNGASEGQFNRPAGVALNKDSKMVFVADTKNNRIQVFNYDGQFMFQWGSLGNSNGKFDRPTDITVDEKNGLVFVTDSDNQRVQLFTAEGTFILAWGSKGEGEDQFLDPAGVSFNAEQNVIYVSDKPGNKIAVYRLSSAN